jgi:hypothetical protein
LKAEISAQSATLALLGENQIGGRLLAASPELRSALAFHRQQLRLAEERAAAAEAVKDGTATDAQRRRLKVFQGDGLPGPSKPGVEPIKARRAVLEAERAALEAEIKSLSTAEDVAAAMRAEEVEGGRRTKRDRQDAPERPIRRRGSESAPEGRRRRWNRSTSSA